MAQLTPRDETKLSQYEQLLAREPTALVFAALASFYARKYEFEKAVGVLENGLRTYPNYFSARVLLAKCYLALDRFDDAVGEIDKVLAHDPYNISALGLLGDELRNRGRLSEARDRYLKILELHPDNEEYAYKLELLYALMAGGPFPPETPTPAPAGVGISFVPAERIPAAAAPPAPREPARSPAAVAAAAPVREEAALPFAADEEEAAEEEVVAAPDELATLTLAKIYEDQGLFVRARDVIYKVLGREPENAAAREAFDHVTALLAAEDSPTGASILQLIKEVNAVAGVWEHDEWELWQKVSAGVVEALCGFEELTVAQAVAAAAGLVGVDFFTVPEGLPASWEFDLGAATDADGAAGADELAVDLPLQTTLDLTNGANVLALTRAPAKGAGGIEEFDTTSGPPHPRAPAAAPARPAAAREDFTLDLKTELAKRRGPPPATAGEKSRPGAPPPSDLTVTPDQYPRRAPLTLEKDPFGKDEDFLGWLDSIKLRGL